MTASLHFVCEGTGPMVFLSHALGADLRMWDEVAERLRPHYTVLRYDSRGHGRSALPTGPYAVEDLAADAAALIRSQTDVPVHFVGLSMGGMVAQALAAHHPDCVRSIVVANSTCFYPEDARQSWAQRMATVRQQGTSALADAVMQRWLTAPFQQGLEAPHGPQRTQSIRHTLESTDREAYAQACNALAALDLRASNAQIRCPALIVCGTQDTSTPPALSLSILDTLPHAQLHELDTAHLSAVEQPEIFASLLLDFFDAQATGTPEATRAS